jgi:hypothetical protein
MGHQYRKRPEGSVRNLIFTHTYLPMWDLLDAHAFPIREVRPNRTLVPMEYILNDHYVKTFSKNEQ